MSDAEVDPGDDTDPFCEAGISTIISEGFAFSNFVLAPWIPLGQQLQTQVVSRCSSRTAALSLDEVESLLQKEKEKLFSRQLLDAEQLTAICLSRLQKVFPRPVVSNSPGYSQIKAACDVLGIEYHPRHWLRLLQLFAGDMAFRRVLVGSPFRSSSFSSAPSSSSSSAMETQK